jgi:hypothetical protein
MRYIILLSIFLQSCIGWGDLLADRKRIVGKYYLIQGNTEEYSLAFDLGNGGFIGRGPSNEMLVAYAYDDSFFIVKTRAYTRPNVTYTVINWKKDDGYNKDKELYLDTIPENLYKISWIAKKNYRFVDVNKTLLEIGG